MQKIHSSLSVKIRNILWMLVFVALFICMANVAAPYIDNPYNFDLCYNFDESSGNFSQVCDTVGFKDLYNASSALCTRTNTYAVSLPNSLDCTAAGGQVKIGNPYPTIASGNNISVYFKYRPVSTADKYFIGIGNNGDAVQFTLTSTGNHLRMMTFFAANGATNRYCDSVETLPSNINAWHEVYFFMTYGDDASVRMYVNGTRFNISCAGSPWAAPYGTTTNTSLGMYTGASPGMLSYIDDFKMALNKPNLLEPYLTDDYYTTKNVFFIDTVTQRPVLALKVDLITSNASYNYTVSNGMFIGDFRSFSTLRYYNDSCICKNFYFLSTNSTDSLILYAGNISNHDNITLTVYDNYNDLVEEAYIYIMRYYVANNSYKLVGMARTDTNGVANICLEKNNEFYKFIVYYPFDTYRMQTTPAYIYQDTLNIQLNLRENAGADFDNSFGVLTELDLYNSTRNFVFTFLDASSTITGANLTIYAMTNSGREIINSTRVNAAAGIINMSIGQPQNGTNYYAVASLIYPDMVLPVQVKSYMQPETPPDYTIWVLADLIITMFVALLFTLSASLAIIVVPIPSLILCLMNLMPQALWPIFGAIELIAVVLAIYISRDG